MTRAVIFDVDGTLVDSVDQHARAWQDAFSEFGHDIALHAIRAQIGKGGDQLMPVFLDAAEIKARGDALQERRAEILKTTYLPTITAFPRVRALFDRLRADGIRIALASSAKTEELQTYKKIADIEDLIDIETSADDAAKSKPHPDIFQAAIARLEGIAPDDMLVIGDTPYDAQAAAKARLATIGVLCGGFAQADLTAAGCVRIYRDPADILDHYEQAILHR